MKRFFTRFNLIGLFTMLLMGGMTAQDTLTVNSPASIAGNYEILRSNSFGAQFYDAITADLIYPDSILGCDFPTPGGVNPFQEDMTGMIALIDRGVCGFIEKALNAQQKGAIAVIICNTATGAYAGPGGADPAITIPAFMMQKINCDAIKVEMSTVTVNATISGNPCLSKDTVENAFFGNIPGEGDFDGGLNGWEITNGWVYEPAGAYGGAFGSGFAQTGTVCNGAIVFASDFLDNGGVAANQGLGECPSPCTGALISPTIALPDEYEGLYVQFDQTVRQYTSQYFIVVSYDGGTTWPDSFPINTTLVLNAVETHETAKIPLCGVRTDADSIKIQFYHVGDYYVWAVDDVYLINEFSGDVKVNSNFHAVAPTVLTPKSQPNTMVFLADIENFGNNISPNTVLNANVYDGALDLLFTRALAYENVDECTIIENEAFAETGEMPTVPGQYFLEYDIDSDDNAIDENDFQGSTFFITENTFNRVIPEEGFRAGYLRDITGGWVDNVGLFGSKDYTVGSYFYVPNGSGYEVDKVRFGIAETVAPGYFVNVGIYKLIEDLDENGDITAEERELVAEQQVYLADGFPNLRNIEVIFLDGDGEPLKIALEDETGYIVTLSVLVSAPTDPFLQILSANLNTTDYFIRSQYYVATSLAQIALGLPHWSLFLGDGTVGLEDRDFFDWYNSSRQLYLSFEIKDASVNVKDYDANISLKVYPNPVQETLALEVDLPEMTKNLTAEVYNVSGVLVARQNYNNVKSDVLTFNVSELPSGVYMTRIATDTGFTSHKFVKK